MRRQRHIDNSHQYSEVQVRQEPQQTASSNSSSRKGGVSRTSKITTDINVKKWQMQKSFVCPLIVVVPLDGNGESFNRKLVFTSSSATNLYSRKRLDDTSTYEKLCWYLSHSNEHALEELIFRGGSRHDADVFRDGWHGGTNSGTSSTHNNSSCPLLSNDLISVPTIMLSRVQELIHSRRTWKKIELTGKGSSGDEESTQSRSAAYLLETLHSRHVLVPTGGIHNHRGGKDRRLAKAYNKITNQKQGSHCSKTVTTMVVEKLVLEHASPSMIQELIQMLKRQYTVKVRCLVFRYTSFKADNLTSRNIMKCVLGATVESLILSGSTFEESTIVWSGTDAMRRQQQQQQQQPQNRYSAIQEVVDVLKSCDRNENNGSQNNDIVQAGEDNADVEANASESLCTASKSKLREVSISDCHLDDTEIEALVEALFPENRSTCLLLESLDLSNNYCQRKTIDAVSKLIGFRYLRHLNLSNQDIWDDRSYFMPLWAAIQSNGSYLETLDLSDNFLHDGNLRDLFQHQDCTTASQESPSSSCRSRSCLRKLILRGNRFTDDGLAMLAESLPYLMVKFPKLSWIDLRRNQKMIEGGHGIKALTRSLANLGISVINNIDPSPSSAALSSLFLWNLFLDSPTTDFLLQLALYRSGVWRGRRGVGGNERSLKDDSETNDKREKERKADAWASVTPELQTMPPTLWPNILERTHGCVPCKSSTSSRFELPYNEVDSLMQMNRISPADCIYRLLPHLQQQK
jgi:hypothetical protein